MSTTTTMTTTTFERFLGAPRALARRALVAVLGCAALALGGSALAARSDPAEQVVGKALAAALANDVDGFMALVHPREKATDDQRSQLQKFTFTRVARQAKWYVKGADADSFEIDRREDMGGGRVKLFVKDLAHPNRAAVPVALERLPSGGFAIISNSL